MKKLQENLSPSQIENQNIEDSNTKDIPAQNEEDPTQAIKRIPLITCPCSKICYVLGTLIVLGLSICFILGMVCTNVNTQWCPNNSVDWLLIIFGLFGALVLVLLFWGFSGVYILFTKLKNFKIY